MTTNRPIKSAAKDYTKEPFYLIQYNGSDKRTVASFQNKDNIKLFLRTFIESIESDVNVKITDLEDYDNPQDFDGMVSKEKINTALNNYDDFFLHDGYHELTLMNPGTSDLIAFDEHGLIYIYADSDYESVLRSFGLTLKPDQKLIYELGHWHYRSADGKTVLTKIIADLKLGQNNWH